MSMPEDRIREGLAAQRRAQDAAHELAVRLQAERDEQAAAGEPVIATREPTALGPAAPIVPAIEGPAVIPAEETPEESV